MLYYKTIDQNTLELLKKLQSLSILSEMRLVGGTSLALQIGHRKSIDIDLFGKLNVEYAILNDELKNIGQIIPLKNSKNIHTYLINNIKVDIVNYEYDWLTEETIIDSIHLADIDDIAAMKLNAIMGRGSKKDFIDLYYILKKITFEDIFNLYNKKYHDGSVFLVLKSMVYFNDADADEMPYMMENVSWNDIKKFISTQHAKYLKSI